MARRSFLKAGLLGRGCAVRGRDGCGRPVGSSAGPCFIRPRITARHFDGGFRLLPAVSTRRWVGPVLHGRQAPCPALARFGRCRGTGGVCGAGTAFLHRAVQALRCLCPRCSPVPCGWFWPWAAHWRCAVQVLQQPGLAGRALSASGARCILRQSSLPSIC